jgi:hypothetical protein
LLTLDSMLREGRLRDERLLLLRWAGERGLRRRRYGIVVCEGGGRL